MKFTKFPLLILTLLFCTITTSGVFATWYYSNEPAIGAEDDSHVGIILFDYKPSEILPGDEEDTKLHENHYNLLTSIVNHVDYGLNASKKPIIRELLLEDHGVVYGDQNVSGGNLKHMLLNTSDVNALMYVVEYVSDTEFNTYTFVDKEANSDSVGQYIQVYKTIIKKNTKWEATLSYEGRAKVFRPGIVSYSIDVKTWEYYAYPKTSTT